MKIYRKNRVKLRTIIDWLNDIKINKKKSIIESKNSRKDSNSKKDNNENICIDITNDIGKLIFIIINYYYFNIKLLNNNSIINSTLYIYIKKYIFYNN